MISKWKTLNIEERGRGRIFRHLVAKRQSRETGSEGEFDLIQTLSWVNMIPLTSDQQVIMVRQYRHGTDQVTLEIPGGAVDIGEETLQAAIRELEEETGYRSTNWSKLGVVHPNPAFMTNICETWLATDCEASGVQNFDDLEEIELELVPLSQIPEKIQNGEITHSLVIAAFHFLSLKSL